MLNRATCCFYIFLFSLLEFSCQINASAAAVHEQLKASEHEFVDAVFEILQPQNKNNAIMRDHEWCELEMDLMLQKLDRAQTVFGFWGMKHLAHPVKNFNEICRRQAIIKKMVDTPLLRLQLVDLFKKIKDGQDDLLSYWDAHDSLRAQTALLYYSLLDPYSWPLDNYLNRNRYALEVATISDLSRSMLALVGILGLSGITSEVMDSIVTQRPANIWKGIREGLEKPIQINSLYPHVYTDGYKKGSEMLPAVFARGTLGDYYTCINAGSNAMSSKIAAGFGAAAVAITSDVVFAQRIHEDIKRFTFLHKSCYALQARMVRIATLFKAIEELHSLLEQHQDIFGHDLAQQLNFMFHSEKVRKLVALLKTDTFDGPAHYFYYRGRVLLANQLLDDVKDELISVFQAVGLIDGYFAIAQIFNDQSPHAPFCFAQFVPEETPTLQLQDFWTPLIPTKKPVLNSVDWYQLTHTKTLITGPNGAGKSTVMKSVAHAIILAQSWGIVPAKKAKLKMFTGLRSSLSPREDLQQNLSTFMAEKKRIDEIREFIGNHNRNDCFFVVLDEPYRGTVEAEAAYRVCLLGKELVSMDHCMLVLASHLEGPISLEKETGKFVNYQLDLKYTDEGKFVRTFKFIPGAALWWFHDADKRRQFVDQLLDKE